MCDYVEVTQDKEYLREKLAFAGVHALAIWMLRKFLPLSDGEIRASGGDELNEIYNNSRIINH